MTASLREATSNWPKPEVTHFRETRWCAAGSVESPQVAGAVKDAASRATAEEHDLTALREMFAMILAPALTTVGRAPNQTS